MINYVIAIAFVIAVAVETQSYSVTVLAILFCVYSAVQDKVNRALLTAQDDQLEVAKHMASALKLSAASQQAYANHVSELRAMVLSTQRGVSEVNLKRHTPTVSQKPSWAPESDYEG